MAISLENTGLEFGVEVMLPLWKAQEDKSSNVLSTMSVFMLVSSSIIMPDRLRFWIVRSSLLDRL
jgi:hypothetical protein